MKGLDRRHRWAHGLREGAHITYECLACGKRQTFEFFIPVIRPNPYRTMFLESFTGIGR
jgi:hypothetical protein